MDSVDTKAAAAPLGAALSTPSSATLLLLLLLLLLLVLLLLLLLAVAVGAALLLGVVVVVEEWGALAATAVGFVSCFHQIQLKKQQNLTFTADDFCRRNCQMQLLEFN